jgi:hypothetical protein
LAQPEKLALWQIKEQAKHRATAPNVVNNLYNRRLDDDDEDKPKKPKVRRMAPKKVDRAYIGVEGRKQVRTFQNGRLETTNEQDYFKTKKK